MKVLLVVFVLVALCTAHHNSPSPQEFQKGRQECFDSLHVPEDVREQIRIYEYANIEIVHRYVRCAAAKLGIWDDSKGYDKEKFLDIVEEKHPDEEVREKIAKCLDNNPQKSDLNAWAYRQHICFVRSGSFEPIKAKFLQH